MQIDCNIQILKLNFQYANLFSSLPSFNNTMFLKLCKLSTYFFHEKIKYSLIFMKKFNIHVYFKILCDLGHHVKLFVVYFHFQIYLQSTRPIILKCVYLYEQLNFEKYNINLLV